MSQDDTRDVKPATLAEQRELVKQTVRAIVDDLTPLITARVTSSLIRRTSEMFIEGVIAGLRVREVNEGHPNSDAQLVVVGDSREDLIAVKPHWCECDPRTKSVCSPRRRPAECPSEQQWDDVQVLDEEDGDVA